MFCCRCKHTQQTHCVYSWFSVSLCFGHSVLHFWVLRTFYCSKECVTHFEMIWTKESTFWMIMLFINTHKKYVCCIRERSTPKKIDDIVSINTSTIKHDYLIRICVYIYVYMHIYAHLYYLLSRGWNNFTTTTIVTYMYRTNKQYTHPHTRQTKDKIYTLL